MVLLGTRQGSKDRFRFSVICHLFNIMSMLQKWTIRAEPGPASNQREIYLSLLYYSIFLNLKKRIRATVNHLFEF